MAAADDDYEKTIEMKNMKNKRASEIHARASFGYNNAEGFADADKEPDDDG